MALRKRQKLNSPPKAVPLTTVVRASCCERLELVSKVLRQVVDAPDDNCHAIHDLRVATRRAAAAIELYSNWLPHQDLKWVEKQLERARLAVGETRDLDVQLQRIVAESATLPAELLLWLVRRIGCWREKSLPAVMECVRRLKKKKFRQRGLKLAAHPRWRGSGREPTLKQHLRHELGLLVKELSKLQKKLGRKTRALHEVRVVLKRVRYRLELLRESSDSPLVEKTMQRLVDLQDQLGHANDDAVLFAQLEEWAEACRHAALKSAISKYAERTKECAHESLAHLAEVLPQELAELVTLMKQIRG